MTQTSVIKRPAVPTSNRPRLPISKNGVSRLHAGFSLIEIMIVMALIGIFVSFGARQLVSNGRKMKSSVRGFAIQIKNLRNRARIDNTTYRMVFNLPEDKDKPQSYWVESSSSAEALLMDKDTLEEREDSLEEDKSGKIPDPQGFQPAGKGGPSALPRGLYFDSIEIAGEDSPFESGRIYIFFFPQGHVQEAAIHLTDRDTLNWTLVINPLTGRAHINPKYVSLKDFIEEDEE